MELFIAVLVNLFSVVNPFGAVPMYLSLTPHYTPQERAKLSFQTSIYFFLILICFFFAGSYILGFFGLDINALRIAGGLVILNSSFALLNDRNDQNKANKMVSKEAMEKADISFSPLAMPMLSGPGSISLLIGLGADNKSWPDRLIIAGVILLNALIVYGVLRLAPALFRLLGRSGLKAGSRIMGFITMAIGVQYIIAGIVALVGRFN